MQNNYRTLLAAMLLPVLLSFAPDWYTYSSNEHGFSMKFPGKPVESSNEITTDIGPLNIKFFTYEPDTANEPNIVYMALVTIYPESKISSDKKDIIPQIFRNAIDGGVSNVKGILVSEKNISLGGYPGRSFKMTYDDGANVITAKAYLVKNRMYMMQTITTKANEDDASHERFLNSFSLLKK